MDRDSSKSKGPDSFFIGFSRNPRSLWDTLTANLRPACRRIIVGEGTLFRSNDGNQCDVELLGVRGLDLGMPSAEEGPSLAKTQ